MATDGKEANLRTELAEADAADVANLATYIDDTKYQRSGNAVLRLVASRSWTLFMLAWTVVAVAFLASADPAAARAGDASRVNDMVAMARPFWTAFFALDAVLKIIGYGPAVALRGSALSSRPGPVLLDVFLVVLEVVLLGMGQPTHPALSLRALSLVRVMPIQRDLRLYGAIVSYALAPLAQVGLLVAFVVLFLGAASVHLWGGLLHGQCAYTDVTTGDVTLVPGPVYCALSCDQQTAYLQTVLGDSSIGSDRCTGAWGSTCATYLILADTAMGTNATIVATTCVFNADRTGQFAAFDDIGTAMATIWAAVTTEGWLSVTTGLEHTFGLPALTTIIWALIACTFSLFLFQLAYGAVWVSLYIVRDKVRPEQEESIVGQPDLVPLIKGEDGKDSIDWDAVRDHAASTGCILCCVQRRVSPKQPDDTGERYAPASDSQRALRPALHAALSSTPSTIVIGMCILANMIVLSMARADLDATTSRNLDVANTVFTAIFTAELLLWFVASGPGRVLSDAMGWLDLFIVVTSIVDAVLTYTSDNQPQGLSAVRALRALRALKLARSWKRFHRTFVAIYRYGPDLIGSLSLFLLMYLAMAIIGMHWFAGVLDGDETWGVSWGFDNIGQAYVSALAFNNFAGFDLMPAMMEVHGVSAFAYFFILLLLGPFIFGNLLITALVQAVLSEQEQYAAAEADADAGANKGEGEANKGKDSPKPTASSGEGIYSDPAASPTAGTGVSCNQAEVTQAPPTADKTDTAAMLKRAASLQLLHEDEEEKPATISLFGTGTSVSLRRVNDDGATESRVVTVLPSGEVLVKEHGPTGVHKRGRRGSMAEEGQHAVHLMMMNLKCVANSAWSQAFFMAIILWSVVNLALDEPRVAYCGTLPADDPDNCIGLARYLSGSDIAITFIFVVEMAMMIAAHGLWGGPDAYLASGWHWLDAFVVVTSVASLIMDATLGSDATNSDSVIALASVRAIRVLRVFRALRTLHHVPGLRAAVSTFVLAARITSAYLVVNALVVWIFAIAGVQLFSGSMQGCNDPDMASPEDCTGTWTVSGDNCAMLPTPTEQQACLTDGGADFPRVWESPFPNFDGVGPAAWTVLQLAFYGQWPYVPAYRPWQGVGSPDQDGQRDMGSLAFCIVVQFVLAFFLVELFLVGNWEAFYEAQSQLTGGGLMTNEQQEWVARMRALASARPQAALLPPEPPKTVTPAPPNRLALYWYKLRTFVYNIVSSWQFDTAAMLLVVASVIVVAAARYDGTATYDGGLGRADDAVAILFAIEAGLKIIGYGVRQYFSRSWHRFEFIIVVLTFVGALLQSASGTQLVALLRLARIFRIVRLLQSPIFKPIRLLLRALLPCLPAYLNVLLLLGFILFVGACVGMAVLGNVRISVGGWPISNDPGYNFYTFGSSVLTLLSVLLGDGLSVATGYVVGKPYCTDNTGTGVSNCGQLEGAPILFAAFFIIANCIILSILIVVISNEYYEVCVKQDSHASGTFTVTADVLASFEAAWTVIDPKATGQTNFHGLVQLVAHLPTPLGILPPGTAAQSRGMGSAWGRAAALRLLKEVDVPAAPRKPGSKSQEATYKFLTVLDTLVAHATNGAVAEVPGAAASTRQQAAMELLKAKFGPKVLMRATSMRSNRQVAAVDATDSAPLTTTAVMPQVAAAGVGLQA